MVAKRQARYCPLVGAFCVYMFGALEFVRLRRKHSHTLTSYNQYAGVGSAVSLVSATVSNSKLQISKFMRIGLFWVVCISLDTWRVS